MKIFLLSLSFIFPFLSVSHAQRPTGGMPAGAKMPSIGRIYGKLIDADTKQAVPYASVVVVRSMGKRDTMLGGALTLDNGEFNIADLPFGPLKVKITMVGAKDFTQQVMISPPDNVELDLGNIKFQSDTKLLNAVDVTAQKSQVQMSLDKKVFNVDKNITTTGGTAEDVLKNIPSVSVTVDGGAQLRNQATTVYVDGRPTPLSINQIPADQIEQVEVITNPSAKFEASTTGGIINLILKKNRKPGYNGFVSVGGGVPGRANASTNLNYKEGRVNISAFYNLNLTNNQVKGYNYQTKLLNGAKVSQFDQTSLIDVDQLFQVGRLALDYQVSNRNTVTFAGSATNGRFNFNENQLFNFQNLAISEGNYNGTRNNEPNNQFRNYNGQLLWKKTFPKKGQELTVDVNGNFGNSTNNSTFKTNTNYIRRVPFDSTELQQNSGGNKGYQAVFQLDYTNPINDSTKIEMGVRSFYNDRDQRFIANLISADGKSNLLRGQSTDINVIEAVNAAYFTYTGKFKNGIAYQAGLRYEQSNFDGTSRIDNDGKFGYNYPSQSENIFKSFFPSLYLSKKLGKTAEMQVNVSRKIARPDFMQLMPFIRQADNSTISRGNPKLRPEFVTLAELNYNQTFGANNWLISLYYVNEDDPIKQIAFPYKDDPTKIEFNFINGLSEDKYGLDNTYKFTAAKDLEITTNANVFNTIVTTNEFSNSGWAANGKAIVSWKLPKDFSVQLTGNYEGRRIQPQGYREGIATADFALKKDFNRLTSLTFAVNDIFDSRKQIVFTDTPTLFQEQMRRREVRNFRLTFQMRFGKMDASIFRSRKKGGQEQQQGMDY